MSVPGRKRFVGCNPEKAWLRGACGLAAVAILGYASSVSGEAANDKGAAARAIRPNPEMDTWHTATIARSERGVMVVNFWSKRALFRAETIVIGRRINTLVNGRYYYIFDAVEGTGVQIERSAKAISEDADRGRPFGTEFESIVGDGGEVIKDGILPGLGIEFEVYQLTDSDGRKQVYVTRDEPRLPLRVERFIRSAGQTSVLEYSGWQQGLVIADSFFSPPTNIQFEKVSYDDYVHSIRKRAFGPAPVFYRHLLHGAME